MNTIKSDLSNKLIYMTVQWRRKIIYSFKDISLFPSGAIGSLSIPINMYIIQKIIEFS
jgi:hypothetical protein